jgi:hypothetical protein
LFLALGGCASFDGRGLVPGQSSERDVVAVMGTPAEKEPVENGDTIYWYPRHPWGMVSYAARIDADGRLVALEQRLTGDNIDKVVRGKSTAKEVHDLLGPPWRPEHYARLQRDIWTYPMRVAGRALPQWFLVQLSPDGVVRETYLIDNPHFVPRDGGRSR